jgi:hypothetical protein
MIVRSARRYDNPMAIRATRAIAEALFCSEQGPPAQERIDFLLGEIDTLLTRAGWRSGGIYKLGLFAICLLAPLAIFRMPTLGRLPLVDRVRALRKLEHGATAALVIGVKAILCLMYYEHPAATETGYTPHCKQVSA